MDLKSIILAAGLAVGYAAPAEAARITKEGVHHHVPDFHSGGAGHARTFQRYTILSERGDTLETIATQIVKRGITGLEGGPYKPERVYESVLKQLQRQYPVDSKIVLSTGTILRYDKTTSVRRGFHLNL